MSNGVVCNPMEHSLLFQPFNKDSPRFAKIKGLQDNPPPKMQLPYNNKAPVNPEPTIKT